MLPVGVSNVNFDNSTMTFLSAAVIDNRLVTNIFFVLLQMKKKKKRKQWHESEISIKFRSSQLPDVHFNQIDYVKLCLNDAELMLMD